PAAQERPGAGTGGSAPMHPERTADPARLSGSVRGLGVCDVLRLELEPIQLARLIDELDERAGDLDTGLEIPGAARPRPADEGMDEDCYELWLVRLMRAGLPDLNHPAPFAWSGPSGLVTSVVRACLRASATEFATLATDLPRGQGVSARLEAVS